MDSKQLALDMLTALIEVLEQHNVPSKYYVEHLGSVCDAEADSIVEQELQAEQ
jgi:hypothetical protein